MGIQCYKDYLESFPCFFCLRDHQALDAKLIQQAQVVWKLLWHPLKRLHSLIVPTCRRSKDRLTSTRELINYLFVHYLIFTKLIYSSSNQSQQSTDLLSSHLSASRLSASLHVQVIWYQSLYSPLNVCLLPACLPAFMYKSSGTSLYTHLWTSVCCQPVCQPSCTSHLVPVSILTSERLSAAGLSASLHVQVIWYIRQV